jgi:hypothetical protein
MSVEKLTKKDTLINLYNQILQDVTVAEVQVKFFHKLSLISVDPKVSAELAQWETNHKQALERLGSVAELLEIENKAPERTIN